MLATKAEVFTLVFLSSKHPYFDGESNLFPFDTSLDSAKMKCDCLGPIQPEPDIFVFLTGQGQSCINAGRCQQN